MKTVLIIVFIVSINLTASAQKDVVQILKAYKSVEPLTKAYLTPMARMIGEGMNSGWYHSAKPKRFMSFGFSVSMSQTSAPNLEKGFYLTRIPGFEENYSISGVSGPISPNVAGKTDDLPTIIDSETRRQIVMPDGSGFDRFSLPVIRLSMGLPYHTQISLKYTPKYNMDYIGKATQYGVGLKHSIKEYLPGIEFMPAFSMSIFGNYSYLNDNLSVNYPASNKKMQELQGKAQTYAGKVLVGMDFKFISVFAAMGYGGMMLKYTLSGNYYVDDVDSKNEVSDPVKISYDFSGIEFNLGASVKLGIFDVFADFSPDSFQTFNFGVGVNYR